MYEKPKCIECNSLFVYTLKDKTIVCRACGYRNQNKIEEQENTEKPKCIKCNSLTVYTTKDGTIVCKTCGHRHNPNEVTNNDN